MGFAAVVRAEDAFSAAMSAAGLAGHTYHAEGSILGGKRLAIALAAQSPRPTAIIGFNSDDTHGLVIGAHAAGLSIPEDLSIISIGTPSAFAEGTEPALTTVSPPAHAIGAAATRMLIRSIEQSPDKAGARHLFAGELVVRGSTGPPPA
jgi:DNA-binding LacI/PurR family transcriptional regulator